MSYLPAFIIIAAYASVLLSFFITQESFNNSFGLFTPELTMQIFIFCIATGFLFGIIDVVLVYQESYKSLLRKNMFRWSLFEFAILLILGIISTYMYCSFAVILTQSTVLLASLIAMAVMASG